MAPVGKENDVLIATPETASSVPSGVGTETSTKPLPVALEVPVTVNGARAVEGSGKREPFSETTKTVLVFGNGAVIRLASPVAAGQLLFLTNEKTKKEVVCQVVKSKNYRNVSGYVELEFTESVVGFWGMRFPTDRVGVRPPAPVQAAVPPTAQSAPLTPVSVAPKAVTPIVNAAPKTPEVKAVAPAAQVTPVAKKPEAPLVSATPIAASPASSVASLLSEPEPQPAVTPWKPPVPPITIESKQEPAPVSGDKSTEELKRQAARLQEQLSSMLFSAAPTTKPALPAPVVPALEAKAASDVAASVLELAKAEPAPLKFAPVAKTPVPPVKSSLDTEEVKIPSWLEPLARNAAAPAATPDLVEREKINHAPEIAAREEGAAEAAPVAAVESAPEIQLPAFGSLLLLDEEVPKHKRSSRGSPKGVGMIAAGILLAAGGAWYLFRPTSAVRGTTASVASAVNPQASAPAPAVPSTQPASQNTAAARPATSVSSAAPPALGGPAASSPIATIPVHPAPAPVTLDKTGGAGTTIPASATERIPRPAPEHEVKKAVLGEVHLASPTVNRPADAQDGGVDAPAISGGTADANPAGLDAGLAAGSLKQPAAPEAPLPVGGDVKSAKLIRSVSPQYPMLAKNQHLSGSVVIDALIDPNGRVSTMKVLSGPALLHQAAMDALKQWKYEPATLDGKPAAMHVTVTMQFRPE